MSTVQGGIDPSSFLASGDFTGKRGYAVYISAADTVSVVSSAGAKAVGILLDEPAAAARACAVAVTGKTRAIAGSGGFTVGDLLKANASGLLVAAQAGYVNTSDSGAAQDPVVGSYVLAVALESAAENEYGDVLIIHAGVIATTAA